MESNINQVGYKATLLLYNTVAHYNLYQSQRSMGDQHRHQGLINKIQTSVNIQFLQFISINTCLLSCRCGRFLDIFLYANSVQVNVDVYCQEGKN